MSLQGDVVGGCGIAEAIAGQAVSSRSKRPKVSGFLTPLGRR